MMDSRALRLPGVLSAEDCFLAQIANNWMPSFGDFGRRQPADLDAVENLAQLWRNIGRAASHLLADRDVLEGAHKRNAVVAILETTAQRLRFAPACVDERVRCPGRNEEQDRTQGVVIADAIVGFGFHDREYFLFSDLQAGLVTSAH